MFQLKGNCLRNLAPQTASLFVFIEFLISAKTLTPYCLAVGTLPGLWFGLC